jgi:molybdate transport system ATP-binding protein
VIDSGAAILDVSADYRVHPGLELNVSLRLGREIGVIFGPSGAGKTTLLRLIAGLTTPGGGHVRLEDQVLFDASRAINRPLRSRRLGMIFQDDCLFPHLSVAANVAFGLKGWRREPAAARLREVAALCGIEQLLDRRPASLSGGERQRVGLARALAPRPRLLLCDEPVSALDLANRHALLERLRNVQRVEAIPMLYVTHSPSEAIYLSRKLFLLEQGRVVAYGDPLDVLSAPAAASAVSTPWEGMRNVFRAVIVDHTTEETATRIAIADGPELIVPFVNRANGTRVVVEVRADDILLARQPIGGLSARNQIAATVERVVRRGTDAEAVIRTGAVTWLVSLVAPAVEQLELSPGAAVQMIVKARSCHIVTDDAPSPHV